MPDPVRILPEILEAMVAHARREPHIECCGLLAGRDGMITTIFPTPNVLASPTAYEVAPQKLSELFRMFREAGLQHLGQYHSHLATENVPSPTDIEQAGYPNQAYFIVALRANEPRPVRAFSIREGKVEELEIEVL